MRGIYFVKRLSLNLMVKNHFFKAINIFLRQR